MSTQEKTLYQRIGGYDVLAAAVDEFFQLQGADPLLARLNNFSLDSQNRQRQYTLDFLSQGTGGPTIYLGRSVSDAHKGLRVNQAEWDAIVGHLRAGCDHAGMSEGCREELVDLFSSYKDDVVEV